jgi:hypothetical protein
MMELPIRWLRDLTMLTAAAGCQYLLFRYRSEG